MDLHFKVNSWSDSIIDKNCLILIIQDERYLREKKDYKMEIADKIFNLNVEVYLYAVIKENDKVSNDLVALVLFYNIYNRKSFENMKNLFKFGKNLDVKLLVGVSNKGGIIKKRKVSKEEGETIAKENGFDYYEMKEPYEIYKILSTKLYGKYYNKEEKWKIYQINNLLNEYFNKKIDELKFFENLKNLLEKSNKFNEIKIDENIILNETFTLFSNEKSQDIKITSNEFNNIINKLDDKLKTDFLISCLINNAIYQGKLNFKNEIDKIAYESIKEKILEYPIGENNKDIVEFKDIYNYYKNEEIIFSYKTDYNKNELIPVNVSESNEKYQLELTLIFNQKEEITKSQKIYHTDFRKKLFDVVKKNLSKKLIQNYNDYDIVYMNEYEELKDLLDKKRKEILKKNEKKEKDEDDKNELLKKKEEDFIKKNDIIKKKKVFINIKKEKKKEKIKKNI